MFLQKRSSSRTKTALLGLTLSLTLILTASNTVAGSAPYCYGEVATVYVDSGFIVGGPDDGDAYTGELKGTFGDDVIVGTDGDDEIEGRGGADYICSGLGDDTIEGDSGDDVIFGGEGNDTIDGSIGTDIVCGGAGDDSIEGGTGDDKIDSGPGSDTVEGDTGSDICTNSETVTSCEDTVTAVVECNDSDGDGVIDDIDICPNTPDPAQHDNDGDANGGDACDPDDDNDGLDDTVDNCDFVENVGQEDTDGDGEGDACDEDDDNDSVNDSMDNCDLVANPDQANADGDDEGDACDNDADNDNADDSVDNCPMLQNFDQLDTDGDGDGNACDADDDNDGVSDEFDNCVIVSNSGQDDVNENGVGDACDPSMNLSPGQTLTGNLAKGEVNNSSKGGRQGGNSVAIRHALRFTIARELGVKYASRRPTLEIAYAPGAFGGSSDGGLSESEKRIVCSMKRSLTFQEPLLEEKSYKKMFGATSYHLHKQLGRDESVFVDALNDPDLCDPKEVAVSEDIVTASEEIGEPSNVIKVFPVDEYGVPLSTSDAWNACIRNLMYFDKEGRPYNCARHHVNSNSSKKWMHPDIHVEFEWNNRIAGWLTLPDGYQPMLMTEGNKIIFKQVGQMHVASIVNRAMQSRMLWTPKRYWNALDKVHPMGGRSLQKQLKIVSSRD